MSIRGRDREPLKLILVEPLEAHEHEKTDPKGSFHSRFIDQETLRRRDRPI
jgi:hypothetical protein